MGFEETRATSSENWFDWMARYVPIRLIFSGVGFMGFKKILAR